MFLFFSLAKCIKISKLTNIENIESVLGFTNEHIDAILGNTEEDIETILGINESKSIEETPEHLNSNYILHEAIAYKDNEQIDCDTGATYVSNELFINEKVPSRLIHQVNCDKESNNVPNEYPFHRKQSIISNKQKYCNFFENNVRNKNLIFYKKNHEEISQANYDDAADNMNIEDLMCKETLNEEDNDISFDVNIPNSFHVGFSDEEELNQRNLINNSNEICSISEQSGRTNGAEIYNIHPNTCDSAPTINKHKMLLRETILNKKGQNLNYDDNVRNIITSGVWLDPLLRELNLKFDQIKSQEFFFSQNIPTKKITVDFNRLDMKKIKQYRSYLTHIFPNFRISLTICAEKIKKQVISLTSHDNELIIKSLNFIISVSKFVIPKSRRLQIKNRSFELLYYLSLDYWRIEKIVVDLNLPDLIELVYFSFENKITGIDIREKQILADLMILLVNFDSFYRQRASLCGRIKDLCEIIGRKHDIIVN
ncbi:uncharacterized protein VNE69_02247 [Vairimorpha necatrix]|uniref:Uncharacterized protein n=1 Tax=Vairimorpha necatrix TaxID=6039 RepID=A0AAX4JA46_9MICR